MSDQKYTELLKQIAENSRKERMTKLEEFIKTPEHITRLKEIFGIFNTTKVFEVGQIVKWKKGLKNKNFPIENQPAIVLEILKEPIYGEGEYGTPIYREKLDLILGMIDEEEEFIHFYFDSRRFEPYEK